MSDWKQIVREHLAPLRLSPERELEIVEELAQDLEAVYDEAIVSGATEPEAYECALREIADWRVLECELSRVEQPVTARLLNQAHVQTETRRRGGMYMESLLRDLRYGLRGLLKNPGFTAMAVLTLALGIGANTAIFSVVNALLLQPLPVKDGDRIVEVRLESPQRSRLGMFSYPDFVALREQGGEVIDLFTQYGVSSTLGVESGSESDNSEPEQIVVQFVSGNYFPTIGATMALGRMLTPDDDRMPDVHPVVVLSHGFWQRRFGSDPDMVGKTLMIKSHTFTVVGVAAPGFIGLGKRAPDLWAPMEMLPQVWGGKDPLRDPNTYWLGLRGRLKPGVSSAQAEARLNGIFAQLAQDRSESVRRHRVKLLPGSLMAPEERKMLASVSSVALGAVALVLLIACANVASLMLARMATRQREIAVRLSLGASRYRLIRQLLAESLLLAAAGGLGGLLVSRWASDALSVPLAEDFPWGISLDVYVIGYAIFLSLLTAIAFGLMPAWQATRVDLVQALKQEGGLFGQRLGRSRLRSALVVLQVAVSLVLLIGAGLFVRALHRAMTLDPGFEMKNNWVMEFNLNRRGYDQTRATQFHRDLQARLKAMPAVQAVVLLGDAPLGGYVRETNIGVAGRKPLPDESEVRARYNMVTPNYFSVLRVPLLRGRAFNDQEANAESPVVVIGESLARAHWPNQDPVGKLLWIPPEGAAEIVGVAKDARNSRLQMADEPYFYRPIRPRDRLDLRVLVKTHDPAIFSLLKESAQALDPRLKVSIIRHEEVMKEKFGPAQLVATLSSLFGVLALLLAALGLYGLISYAVEQRTREIGVRIALGAQTGDVIRLVMRQGMRLVVIGGLLGLIGSVAVTRILKAALYGVSPTDPLTFAAITLLLGAVALLACWIPARRAARVDPMVSLRHE